MTKDARMLDEAIWKTGSFVGDSILAPCITCNWIKLQAQEYIFPFSGKNSFYAFRKNDLHEKYGMAKKNRMKKTF